MAGSFDISLMKKLITNSRVSKHSQHNILLAKIILYNMYNVYFYINYKFHSHKIVIRVACDERP